MILSDSRMITPVPRTTNMSLAQPDRSPTEIPIQLSAAAIAEIQRLYRNQGHPPTPRIRINLASGGCEQFLYDLTFVPEPDPDDYVIDYQGLVFCVPSNLRSKIWGLQIDYSEDLMGGGFRYHNPNASQHCSCGNSFSVNKLYNI